MVGFEALYDRAVVGNDPQSALFDGHGPGVDRFNGVDDGEQAVAAWEAEPWDVILMDVQMPKMDGPTAVGIIRQREAATGRARTPIIALTANVMTHQINEYLAVGMDTCVAKPLQIAALVEAIVKVTEGEEDDTSASEAA